MSDNGILKNAKEAKSKYIEIENNVLEMWKNELNHIIGEKEENNKKGNAKQIKENLENSKNKLSAEDNYAETITEIEQNIEDIKNHLVDDNMVVKKGTNRITVKVFPQ